GEFTPNLVFVIMAFNSDGCEEVYRTIQASAERLRLTARRADDSIGSGMIIREITELIEAAEFIITDLTHERPNVYYELGYAHGVGNESSDILLIAREGTALHFDISPFRVHYYRSVDHLAAILAEQLPRMIASTRKGGEA